MRHALLTISLLAIAAIAATADLPTTRTAMNNIDTPTTKPTTQGAACSVDGGGCGVDHWKGKTEEEWKKILTPEQYQIARQAGTERAFTGKYWDTKTPGVYQCAACGQPLFSSKTKFDSGTGWPSFWEPIAKDAVSTHTDHAHGMVRTEVRCAQCNAHLGHVFDDGPKPTSLRYCMNSAVLNLIPDKSADKSDAKK